MSQSINKRWVFVSGGSRGIGAAIVRVLVEHEYSVVFTYRTSAEAAEKLCEQLQRSEGFCEACQCDVSCPQQVQDLSIRLLDRYGAPYAIVNNAGETQDALLYHMQNEAWDSVITNNLRSAFLVSRAFVEALIGGADGCIIHLSSVTAFHGNAGQVNYAATKAGVIGMTRSLAVELGRFNIRVNSIAPGVIATDMAESIPLPNQKRLLAGIPLGRVGHVNDIALAVAYLLGEGGRYISGSTLVIDGGMSA